MPAAIADIRSGLSDAMSTLAGVRVYLQIPDTPNPPCAVIELQRVLYDTTFARGADEFEFSVLLIVARADDRTAQTRVEGYIAGTGLGSVKTAIEADPTLGGKCMSVRVTEASGLQSLERPDGTKFLAVEFSVTIYA